MVDLRADTASSSDKAEVTETEDQSRTHHYVLLLRASHTVRPRAVATCMLGWAATATPTVHSCTPGNWEKTPVTKGVGTCTLVACVPLSAACLLSLSS